MKKTQSVLIFPCGSEEAIAFSLECKLQGTQIVAASSVVNDPSAVHYESCHHLPYITNSEFLPCLRELIDQEHINSIYTAHPAAWQFFHGLIQQGVLPGIQLANASPQLLAQARVKQQRERKYIQQPIIDQQRCSLTDLEFQALTGRALTIYGATDEHKISALCDIASCTAKGDIVEIGCLAGRSAYVLAWLSKKYEIGNLLCIDPWSNEKMRQQTQSSEVVHKVMAKNDFAVYFEMFLLNLISLSPGGVNYLRRDSQSGFEHYSSKQEVTSEEFGNTRYSGSIAVLHIDGNHNYDFVHWDLENWASRLISGGWLIADDYTWPFGDGPRIATDEYLIDHQKDFDIAFVSGGALFARKK